MSARAVRSTKVDLSSETPLPKVRVIATGGTIASVAASSGGAIATTPGEQLIAGLPGVEGICAVEVDEVCRVNGWNMTPGLILDVIASVHRAVVDGVTGVVITHGTDTLEDTAFAVDVFCGHLTNRTPIVVTGAMRAADEVGSDGPRNLLDSLAVAAAAESRSRGVLVAIHQRILPARWTVKARTTGMNPFESLAGPVGLVPNEGVRYLAPPHSPVALPTSGLAGPVAVIAAVTGHDGADIGWAQRQGALGIVLVGTGAGNVPGSYEPAIGRALSEGLPVVITSRCAGLTEPIYAGPGGGSSLIRSGVIDGRGLSPSQARIALMAALSYSPHDVASWFGQI